VSKRQSLLLIYRYFLSKLGEKYQTQDRDREIVTNFLLTLHLTYNLNLIGNKYLFKYMANQFQYRGFSRSFSKYSIANIFGKTSLQRYLSDIKKTELSFIDDSFLKKHNIQYTDLFRDNQKTLKISSSIDRKRFHNTPAGLVFCLETTTLYDKSCRECMLCKFKRSCKEIKQKNVWRASV